MREKILVPLILIVLLVTTSCTREYDNEISLKGTWVIESYLYEWKDAFGTKAGTSYKSLNDCTRKEKMVFTDTELTIYSYEVLSDGSCSETISTSSYKVSDGKLHFSVLNQEVSLELDYAWTSFRLKISAGEDIEGNEYDRKIVRTFVKQ